MVKAAKAPAKKTSPVVYFGAVAAVAAVYLVLSPSGPAPSSLTAAKPRAKSSKDAGQFLPADYEALKNPFPATTVAAVDAFNPAVKKAIGPVTPVNLPPFAKSMIPADLTGGEPNWYFTGCPSTDGVRTALIENTTTGESVYVKAGDAFKAGRVQSIDVSTMVLVGPNGTAAKVDLLPYGETPGGSGSKTSVASNGVLPVPTGVIGGPLPAAIGGRAVGGPSTITLQNGATIQLPANAGIGNGNDLNVTPDTNTNNNGNGRRRRRNRNLGNSNDGF